MITIIENKFSKLNGYEKEQLYNDVKWSATSTKPYIYKIIVTKNISSFNN